MGLGTRNNSKIGHRSLFAINTTPSDYGFRLAFSRLIAEIRSHDESLFNCVACTQDATGEPLIFAGTTEGGILQLAADIGGGESSGGSRRGLDPRQNVDRMGVCGDDIEK